MDTIRETYLARLTQEFNTMSNLVLRQAQILKLQLVGDTTQALVDEMQQNEISIDGMEVKLRDDIVNSIVLYAPRAGDLRRIISYYDTVVDLERIADTIDSISRRMHYLNKQNSIYPEYQENAVLLFDLADSLLQNAVFAFLWADNAMARSVISRDEELDKIHHASHKKLFEQQKQDEKHPHWLADILDLGRILYGMERIGDGATNIAEAVIFLSEGRDIRHKDI
ncbi:MAG: phosphate uptake regulator PhoU [Bacteroidales bacterium]|nr:phosphate uptake regulator PhoU [Bacteroidales bacterium]